MIDWSYHTTYFKAKSLIELYPLRWTIQYETKQGNKNSVYHIWAFTLSKFHWAMKLNAQRKQAFAKRCCSFNFESIFSVFTYESQSNVVWLNFSTDSSIESRGFSATWETLRLANCSNQTLRNIHGRITSPGN